MSKLKKTASDVQRQCNVILNELQQLRGSLKKEGNQLGTCVKLEQIEKNIKQLTHTINGLTKIAVRSGRSSHDTTTV